LRSFSGPVLSLVLVLVLSPAAMLAAGEQTQSAAQATSPTLQDQALRLFIQCDRVPCDMEFFRTELTWVNHVRDQRDADVHVLITGQPTGAGGQQFTFQFIGLRNFEGRGAELVYNTEPNQAPDATRRGILRVLQLGLVPYALDTPLAADLQVTYRPARASGQPTTTDVHDPWNFWVIRTRVGGNFNGEATSKNSSVNGSVSANRTTEDWKHIIGFNGNYSERTFTLSSGNRFTTVQRNLRANGLVARSLTSHWTAGLRAEVFSDTFVNQDMTVGVAPGIEWNLFPYAESTRRQFTFQYIVGYNRLSYDSTTLFDKLEETVFDQTLAVSLDMSQPWGSTGMTFEAAHYLHDKSKYHIRLFADADFRLVRGLGLNFNGNVSRVHDQIYLPRGSATDEEILVRQRQLLTSYRYGFSFGVSYTFGSIFNNVVNPRFRESGGR
jgi:hypothetical protein